MVSRDSRSAEIAGGICGVAAPLGSGPDHDARAAFGESPAGGLLGGVVVAAERSVPTTGHQLCAVDERASRYVGLPLPPHAVSRRKPHRLSAGHKAARHL